MRRILSLSLMCIVGSSMGGCDLEPATVGAFDRNTPEDVGDDGAASDVEPAPEDDDSNGGDDAAEPTDDGDALPPGFEPVDDGGALLEELIQTCTVNTLLFSFDDGSGTTGPEISRRPYTIEGNSIVFPIETLGGVGGRPYIFGELSLTVEGRNAGTGEILVSGFIEGTTSTVDMQAYRIAPASLPDFYEVILDAPGERIDDAFDLVETGVATFEGALDEPFSYGLRWYLGYNRFEGAGFPACDAKAGF